VEELRAQLNEEQVHRRGEDRQINLLKNAVSELQGEVDRLNAQLQDRESVIAALRQTQAELSSQHSAAKEAFAHTKYQCVLLIISMTADVKVNSIENL
jgi:peptidoglycan hydrolase CwlO-like protein